MEVNFEHPLHMHPLTVFEKVKQDFVCYVCEESLSRGLIYGCSSGCNFYLHMACTAQHPKEIQHFFHPCPLFLTNSHFLCNACFKFGHQFGYHCESCHFDIHIECALRPRPIIKYSDGDGDGDCQEEIIQHFIHWHPLKLIDENRTKLDSEVWCGICDKQILCLDSDSAAYACSQKCKFYVHKSCMINIPQQINNHLFHPSCPLILLTTTRFNCMGCEDEHRRLVFSCGKCEFQLHVRCALLPTLDDQSKDADMIQFFGHKHPLLALPHNKKLVDRCGACGENCSLDEDPCFGCKRCNLFLHKSCIINIPQVINHVFHPSCGPLILLTPPSSYKCAGCDDEYVSAALAYSCEKCGFQLDVKCGLLPTLDQSKDADKIQHVSHRHPLLAFPHNNKKHNHNIIASDEVYRCVACGDKCPLESCLCCERCQFFIHRACAIEFTAEAEIHHYFHPLHPLTLSSTTTTNSKCGSCLRSIDEFLLVYRCAKCDFNLHVDCSKPKRQLLVRYEAHSHHLTFFDKTQAVTWCSICDGAALNCYFRCVACDFNLHLYCHPSTPKTITPKCHLHPLTLTESPFQYELISPEYKDEDASDQSDDEFYCDVCEDKRFKHESVYYCEECKFIAETRCVISELLPCLTGSEEHPTGDDRAISIDEENSTKASIVDLKIEMAKLKEKKKPMKVKIEKIKATLKELEAELEPISLKLKRVKKDHFLLNHQLNHYLKGKEESSTSNGSTAADQS